MALDKKVLLLAAGLMVGGCSGEGNSPRGHGPLSSNYEYMHDIECDGSMHFEGTNREETSVGISADQWPLFEAPYDVDYLYSGTYDSGNSTITFGQATLESTDNQENYDIYIKGEWGAIVGWQSDPETFEPYGYDFFEDEPGTPTRGEVVDNLIDEFGIVAFFPKSIEGDLGMNSDNPYLAIPSEEPWGGRENCENTTKADLIEFICDKYGFEENSFCTNEDPHNSLIRPDQ